MAQDVRETLVKDKAEEVAEWIFSVVAANNIHGDTIRHLATLLVEFAHAIANQDTTP